MDNIEIWKEYFVEILNLDAKGLMEVLYMDDCSLLYYI